MNRLKKIIKPIVPQVMIDYYSKKRNEKKYIHWEKEGRPVPSPHLAKQLLIKKYQEKYNLDILVETGTYQGDMVRAQSKIFSKIYSIELSDSLFKKAAKRFKKDKNVTILHGDSGRVLQTLVPTLDKRAFFWLDGHYSGGITAKGEKNCPIFEELDAIYKSQFPHILLIDDARLFEAQEQDYPSLKSLFDYILSKRPTSEIKIEDDIIIIE